MSEQLHIVDWEFWIGEPPYRFENAHELPDREDMVIMVRIEINETGNPRQAANGFTIHALCGTARHYAHARSSRQSWDRFIKIEIFDPDLVVARITALVDRCAHHSYDERMRLLRKHFHWEYEGMKLDLPTGDWN